MNRENYWRTAAQISASESACSVTASAPTSASTSVPSASTSYLCTRTSTRRVRYLWAVASVSPNLEAAIVSKRTTTGRAQLLHFIDIAESSTLSLVCQFQCSSPQTVPHRLFPPFLFSSFYLLRSPLGLQVQRGFIGGRAESIPQSTDISFVTCTFCWYLAATKTGRSMGSGKWKWEAEKLRHSPYQALVNLQTVVR